VFYGAAEFSRDTDFVILAESTNLGRFKRALEDLRAKGIVVPPFESKYLQRGHAIHFRYQHPGRRRTTIELADRSICDLMSLPDLVRAKKIQRDKDWPMVRRLVEANYFQNCDKPNAAQIEFWLLELRTPALLVDLAQTHLSLAKKFLPKRKLLKYASSGHVTQVERALSVEEAFERKKDKLYWAPLLIELEKLRHPVP